ncbi:GAF domain-containing sensor histidine kinase [Candidatus Thiothrix anitrata]|uniref:Sensor protein n=1 Tax=Candidatus Thiothrix anitrata TaxID=2823902 RepID=A0ABX7X3D9_9GAMM|nr:ATP-binding protein [Candidatus Thiothrix anitrata]QTR49917.1 GAF domain-containing protein [Candidatus Thiothrix anitrata]
MEEQVIRFTSPKKPASASSTTGIPPDGARQAYWATQEGRPVIDLPWQAQVSLLLLFFLFTVIGAVYFWAISSGVRHDWLAPLMTALWLLSGAGVLALLYWLWREFSRFGMELSHWAMRLSKGDLSARMSILGKSCPSRKIREQINSITDNYQALSRMQQQRLSRQEKYIAEKKRHLGVLYEVASCINRADSLEDLLNRFLLTLKEVVKAEAATVRLLDKDGKMRLVASIGLTEEAVALEDYLPSPNCSCGRAATDSEIKVRSDISQCNRTLGRELCEGTTAVELLAIPLQYRERILGVYNLFIPVGRYERSEDDELLISIGQHLGMAIEKASSDEDTRTLSIMEERTRMAHELHDSLAQTLASLRFKVRLFDDSLNRGDESVIWQELEGLENTIDEAYGELRSLITHFRAPIDGKGVLRAVERLTERFGKETGMEVFFYHNWHLKDLSRESELEVIRIVQESLTNARKHSQASTVRILMYSSEEGRCSILVEDDGIGLPDPLPEPNPTTGEHIGLRIMQERAERIGGEIHFESEPGEGTLIQLNFDAPLVKKLSDLVGAHPLSQPDTPQVTTHE